MPNITMQQQSIQYEVRESNNATRSRIDIDPSGVTVTVPENSDIDPEQFLRERQDWVLEKHGQIQDFIDAVPERKFEEGEDLLYLGEEHTIRFVDDDQLSIRDGELRIPETEVERSQVREVLEDYLREEARSVINDLLEEYREKIDGEFDRVYIRNQRTKWASCSPKDNLSFNWRLIMAPRHVIEYVVVHELVHLEEKDHSRRFWSRVENILPEYRESRRWLEQNSAKLVFTEEDLAK